MFRAGTTAWQRVGDPIFIDISWLLQDSIHKFQSHYTQLIQTANRLGSTQPYIYQTYIYNLYIYIILYYIYTYIYIYTYSYIHPTKVLQPNNPSIPDAELKAGWNILTFYIDLFIVTVLWLGA